MNCRTIKIIKVKKKYNKNHFVYIFTFIARHVIELSTCMRRFFYNLPVTKWNYAFYRISYTVLLRRLIHVSMFGTTVHFAFVMQLRLCNID